MPPLVSKIQFLEQSNYTLIGRQDLFEPACPDKSPRLSYEDCDPVYLSHRNNFRMRIHVFDADEKTVPMAMWTIRQSLMTKPDDGKVPKLARLPNGTLLLDDQTGKGGSRDCTEANEPCLGSEKNPWQLTVSGFPPELKTPEGVQFFASILLCDPNNNCAWTYSPPIIIDSSPGFSLPPGEVRYETRRNTSADGVNHYLLFADSLSMNWTMIAPVTKHRETYYMAFRLWHLIKDTGYRELLWLGGQSKRHGLAFSSDYGSSPSVRLVTCTEPLCLPSPHVAW